MTRGVAATMLFCGTAYGVHAARHAVTEAAVQPPRATVRPLFDLRSPERSPFPSDVFTVADARQNTGRRVNLPMPQDCVTHASECEDVALLNQLDGFNMQARISIPFDGDIDPLTVSSKSIFLVKLRDALSGRTNDNSIVGINYIVWDPISREVSRHDRNVGDPGVVNYPHIYLYTVQSPPNFARVALGAQRQIATLFALTARS